MAVSCVGLFKVVFNALDSQNVFILFFIRASATGLNHYLSKMLGFLASAQGYDDMFDSDFSLQIPLWVIAIHICTSVDSSAGYSSCLTCIL
jgi:hypothetical protein